MYIENVLKVKNDWWRYIIGCIVIFIATQIGSIPFIIAIFSKVGLEGSSQIALWMSWLLAMHTTALK